MISCGLGFYSVNFSFIRRLAVFAGVPTGWYVLQWPRSLTSSRAGNVQQGPLPIAALSA